MLKRRHLGVDTWASPIGVEVSTPSVDAQQLTDIARETVPTGPKSAAVCIRSVDANVDALFNRKLPSESQLH